MMLDEQTLEIVRNSPQGVGAEVWRTLLWVYGQGVGIRYGAMLQSSLKRRFREHDETDLAREIESFDRDISKFEKQSSDLISDAIKHGIVCGQWHIRADARYRSELQLVVHVSGLARRDHQLQRGGKDVDGPERNAGRRSTPRWRRTTSSQRSWHWPAWNNEGRQRQGKGKDGKKGNSKEKDG